MLLLYSCDDLAVGIFYAVAAREECLEIFEVFFTRGEGGSVGVLDILRKLTAVRE